MDGPGINQKIRFGYAKAASKLGQPFTLYRSAVPINPINSSNLIGTLLMVATLDWNWMKSNRPGNAIWWLVVDGQDSSSPLSAQEGDYLVGDKTFYILSKEYQMPMSGFECNSVIDIIRPNQSQAIGNVGYVAYQPGTSIPIMTQMPASVLMINRQGSTAPSKLPTDTLEPSWIIQVPNLGGVFIRTGDIIIDNYTDEYVISVNEETEFGWRLTAQQVIN